MGVRQIDRSLEQWQMGVNDLRAEDDLGAYAPGEGEVVCHLAAGSRLDGSGHSGSTGAGSTYHRKVGLGLRRWWSVSPDIRADRRFPPALDQTQQAELKGAVQQPPSSSSIAMANWYWRVVRRFVWERFGVSLSRSSCLNYLHRLGIAVKRPKKRMLKADGSKREAFVAEYAALREEAQWTGAKVFFADEAHFRADAELRGKWVLKGSPALVDSTSPSYGEKASYYSAVFLETGEVEWMELEGNSNSQTSAALLEQLRERHGGRLNVIWDNAPAHRGEAVRELLRKPGLNLRQVNLPGYSPDFNADEAVWGWAKEEATGNLCLRTKAAVQERVGSFLAKLANRPDEVTRRCRTVLQSRADSLQRDPLHPTNAHPTLALV